LCSSSLAGAGCITSSFSRWVFFAGGLTGLIAAEYLRQAIRNASARTLYVPLARFDPPNISAFAKTPPAARPKMMLRNLPSIDGLLQTETAARLIARFGRPLTLDALAADIGRHPRALPPRRDI
jgi:hypothetical protein